MCFVLFGFAGPGQAATLEAKLTASDGVINGSLGDSVSLSGNVALVGASFNGHANPGAGSAYVYRYDGSAWVEEAKLTASDGAAGDSFGKSVSVSGNVALVGAYEDDDAGQDSGSAYVYRYDGSAWVEEAKLTASDGAAFDQFGYSVSVYGNVALVGAYLDVDAGITVGSAYVYRYNGSTWVEEAKLTASDEGADYYGWSVSVSGDVAVVGVHRDDDSGQFSGSAYVYRYDGSAWMEEAKLTASDGDTQGTSSGSPFPSAGMWPWRGLGEMRIRRVRGQARPMCIVITAARGWRRPS